LGALSGSMSAARYHVRGDLPKDVRRSYPERIRLRKFEPLRADEEAEERAGWCAVSAPFDLELTSPKIFQGPYLALGLRVDRYRFPPAVLNAELAQASQALREKNGQERLSRAQKAELKVRIVQRLRRKYLPSMRAVDLVWNLDREQLYFWSGSAALKQHLGALFELSFGLELVPSSPWIEATSVVSAPEQRARLQDVELTFFHAGGGVRDGSG
jgi:recombination associated protein RdgC